MMPNMQTTLFGFETTMQFQIVVKTIVDGTIAESSFVKPALWFEGVLEPMHPRELLVKSEGERKWKWWSLWTDNTLQVDWVIKDPNGQIFRVMATEDWQQGAYVRYQLIEGPGL